MRLQEAREEIVRYGKAMRAAGLSAGTSGNLSVFDPCSGLMAVSPSGMDYETTTPGDVVVLALDGRIAEGERRPSSEWALHAAFYRAKPSVRGVAHTHSPFCTTFAVLGQPLRAVHYAIAAAGASQVPCAPYRLFGTEALAQAAVEGCGAGNAVLLANHGLVACGADLKAAFALAEQLEFVAQLQYRALAVGTPNLLSEAQMRAAAERFQTYGQASAGPFENWK